MASTREKPADNRSANDVLADRQGPGSRSTSCKLPKVRLSSNSSFIVAVLFPIVKNQSAARPANLRDAGQRKFRARKAARRTRKATRQERRNSLFRPSGQVQMTGALPLFVELRKCSKAFCLHNAQRKTAWRSSSRNRCPLRETCDLRACLDPETGSHFRETCGLRACLDPETGAHFRETCIRTARNIPAVPTRKPSSDSGPIPHA